MGDTTQGIWTNVVQAESRKSCKMGGIRDTHDAAVTLLGFNYISPALSRGPPDHLGKYNFQVKENVIEDNWLHTSTYIVLQNKTTFRPADFCVKLELLFRTMHQYGGACSSTQMSNLLLNVSSQFHLTVPCQELLTKSSFSTSVLLVPYAPLEPFIHIKTINQPISRYQPSMPEIIKKRCAPDVQSLSRRLKRIRHQLSIGPSTHNVRPNSVVSTHV